LRVVRNTVKSDPDAPTLAEVRQMLDVPPDDAASGTQAAEISGQVELDD
jgi:hypothetical protein